jgi:hypothetical protein
MGPSAVDEWRTRTSVGSLARTTPSKLSMPIDVPDAFRVSMRVLTV